MLASSFILFVLLVRREGPGVPWGPTLAPTMVVSTVGLVERGTYAGAEGFKTAASFFFPARVCTAQQLAPPSTGLWSPEATDASQGGASRGPGTLSATSPCTLKHHKYLVPSSGVR